MNQHVLKPAHESHLDHMRTLVHEMLAFQRDHENLQVTLTARNIRRHAEVCLKTDYPEDALRGMMNRVLQQLQLCLPFHQPRDFHHSIMSVINILADMAIDLDNRSCPREIPGNPLKPDDISDNLLLAMEQTRFLQSVSERVGLDRAKVNDSLGRLVGLAMQAGHTS